MVKTDKDVPLEGMMVQLIAKKSGIRTTVYSHANGHYEFPKMDAGDYVLRIALPREYLPYVKEQVAINGAEHLDDIVLKHVTETTVLPPTAEGVVARQVYEPALLPPSAWMASQLSGAEWLMSLPGTAEEKHVCRHNCNRVPFVPADFPQPFRRGRLEESRLPDDARRRFAARSTSTPNGRACPTPKRTSW